MAYTFEVKTIQPQAVASIRVDTTPTGIASTFAEILGEVWNYLVSLGVQPVGPPFGRYHEYWHDHVSLEGGLPVAEPVAPSGRIIAGELPGGKVAVTWHVGPYDTLSQAYSAFEAWSKEQKLEPGGASWEVYWTDPGEEPDPSTWKTELIWPLK